MKHLPSILGFISVAFQAAIGFSFLWIANLDSLKALLGNDVSVLAPAINELIVLYRGLLSLARSIFLDTGVVLLCCAALSVFAIVNRPKS